MKNTLKYLFVVAFALLVLIPPAVRAQQPGGDSLAKFFQQSPGLRDIEKEIKLELLFRKHGLDILTRDEWKDYQDQDLVAVLELWRDRSPDAIYGAVGMSLAEALDVKPVPWVGMGERAETFEDTIRRQAESVCLIFANEDHLRTYLKGGISFRERYKPCESIFWDEFPVSPRSEIWATTTGFLIDSTKLITSGHTVCDRNTCFLWDGPISPRGKIAVFGLYGKPGPVLREELEVVPIRSVLAYCWRDEVDFSLLQLERAVSRPGLKVQWEKPSSMEGRSLYAIGHPFGLPLMYHYNGFTREVLDHHFSCNLDLFRGNSGGPVFDRNTHRVLGIVHAGSRDLGPGSRQGGRWCKPYDLYPMQSNDYYEVVFRLSYLAQLIKQSSEEAENRKQSRRQPS